MAASILDGRFYEIALTALVYGVPLVAFYTRDGPMTDVDDFQRLSSVALANPTVSAITNAFTTHARRPHEA